MATSVFELFKIGIGPSSSHTVGPMKAARRFAAALAEGGLLDRTASVAVELHGSLGATGRGHGTDRAVLLGLLGETPEGVEVEAIPRRLAELRARGRLAILGRREIAFREAEHLRFFPQPLPFTRTAFGSRRATRRAAPCSRGRATRWAVASSWTRTRRGGPARGIAAVPSCPCPSRPPPSCSGAAASAARRLRA
jgi:hypothetical protein